MPMTQTMKRLFLTVGSLVSATTLFTASAQAQTCTTATCNAKDCSQPGVLAALPNASAPATVVVNIPSCPGTAWTAGQTISYSVPSNVTSLTIVGAGSQTTTGGGDHTVIIDHTAAPILININTAATQALRLSGITFEADSGSTRTTNGMVAIGGKGTLRVDHVHFKNAGVGSGEVFGIIYGSITGVFDHSLWDMAPGGVDNGIRVNNGQTMFGDTSGNANGSWANPTNPGSAGYLFFEDNVFNYSISNDCNGGGRQVFRHNVFNDSSIQTHEMTGDSRGCRATEVYNNTFNGVNGDAINSFTIVGCRMGTCLVWGNSVSLYGNVISLQHDRTNGHPFLTSPNGFGYCGTLGATAGPSNWDGNSTTTAGYPCLDQPGRGQGDMLSGNFPNKCNVTTNPGGCSSFTGSWPHNKLEPIYEWLNKYQVGAGNGWNHGMYNPDISGAGVQIFHANRDFYQYTLSWNGSQYTGTPFNGTVGTGSGLLSARTATCTAGPGGPFGVSPTGSYGVAYWATDANAGNGELYVCTATNTWTPVYTPYTYPHPFTGGTASVTPTPPVMPSATPPAPPSGLTATVH
jgi:hypothetical protein